jgi:uncharacterized membrane protein
MSTLEEQLTTEFGSLVRILKEITGINEFHALNAHLSKLTTGDKPRVTRLHEVSKNQIQRTVFQYLALSYRMHMQRYWIRVMFLTLVVYALIMMAAGYVLVFSPGEPKPMWILYTVGGVLGFVYFMTLIIWYIDLKQKTKYNFNKYYFQAPNIAERPRA